MELSVWCWVAVVCIAHSETNCCFWNANLLIVQHIAYIFLRLVLEGKRMTAFRIILWCKFNRESIADEIACRLVVVVFGWGIDVENRLKNQIASSPYIKCYMVNSNCAIRVPCNEWQYNRNQIDLFTRFKFTPSPSNQPICRWVFQLRLHSVWLFSVRLHFSLSVAPALALALTLPFHFYPHVRSCTFVRCMASRSSDCRCVDEIYLFSWKAYFIFWFISLATAIELRVMKV